MNDDKLRDLIREAILEELEKLNDVPVIKDIHLHVHGNKMDIFRLIDAIAQLQNVILEGRILETLNKRLQSE